MGIFIILDDYVQPLVEVERVYPAHQHWLEQYHQSGQFLNSGRRVPPVGEVILAHAQNREEIQAIIAEDPFFQEEIAEYEIIEFQPTQCSPELSYWLNG